MKEKGFRILFLFLGLVFSSFVSVLWGAVEIDLFSIFTNIHSLESSVFFQIRVPRVLLAVLLGGSLAWSGVVVQTLFRNPIVEPGLIGITAGSSLAAAISIVLGNLIFAQMDAWVITFFSFFGGMFVCFLIFFVSKSRNKAEIYSLLLVGIAINALCFSGIGFLSYIASEPQLRSLSSWNLGSLSGASWDKLYQYSIFLIFPPLLSPFLAKGLNILSLGENEANHLGLSVESFKLVLVVLVGVSVGASLSVAGSIGFVGLVVPHIMRMFVGQNHNALLCSSYLGGGILLTFSDTICRNIVSPSEIPVGILTAILGAPVFLHLLRKRKNNEYNS